MPKKKYRAKVGGDGQVALQMPTQPTKKKWKITIGKFGEATVTYDNSWSTLPYSRFPGYAYGGSGGRNYWDPGGGATTHKILASAPSAMDSHSWEKP